MKKRFFFRLVVFLLPIFFIWSLITGRIIVPSAVMLNEIWINKVYENIGAEVVRGESQTWRVRTNLFNAARPYAHNSHQPNLTVNGYTWFELGDLKGITLCWPVLMLLMLSYKPKIKPVLLGSLYAFLLILYMAALMVFYEVTKAIVEGEDSLRIFRFGYVFVPERPPEWLVKFLKVMIDTSFNFLIMVAPIAIWLGFYWQELKQDLVTNQEPKLANSESE